MQTSAVAATGLDGLDDRALVERARNRDGAAVRLIMQRHNRRLYRVARGVLNDDAEAEDVVQEAYVRAFTHLDGFRGEAQLSTWLTRIALNEALGRLRRLRTTVDLKDIDTINDQGEARVIYLPSARPGRGAALTRTSHGRVACPVPYGACSPGHRGDEHRGNSSASGPAPRDGQDTASPRPASSAAVPRQNLVIGREGRVSMRRSPLRPDHGSRARQTRNRR
jgi:RNA polymerase sigma factor (sigma-70 family)